MKPLLTPWARAKITEAVNNPRATPAQLGWCALYLLARNPRVKQYLIRNGRAYG